MRRALPLVAPAILLLSLACQPRAAAPVYGPWEEGLTLAFEDPSQPQPQRSADRLQVRVARSSMAPGAPRLVQLDLTSLRGQMSLLVRHQDGGIALLGDDGRVVAQTLPAGFPAVTAWEARGAQFRVVGRATWEGAALLPATSDPVGVWVEARPLQGPHRRTLYLPNLGEVEAQEERDGAWITVNRLVARGFVDLPAAPRP
ncbi:hypothetical protein [Geothrix oryzisoli]|uniref:hypothetical protein n=1 Tax=Geothrix oryzisoli TaxID=2922721 RepID=UPI001FAE4E4E|nr:hypothetical protein [Geothrix oryzisoli]